MTNEAMKTNKLNKRMLALSAALVAAVVPQSAWASTELVKSTGVSDESLFTILAVIAAFQLIAIMVVANVIKSVASNQTVWKMRWDKASKAIATLLLVGASGSLFAADADFDSLIMMSDTGFIVLVMLNLFLFSAFIYLVVKLNGLFKVLLQDEHGKAPAGFWSRFNRSMTDAVPIEEEGTVMTDHEYDGIKELDNNLPPWWLYGFYVSIVFAFIYFGYYHVGGDGPSSAEEYAMEMEEAEAAIAAVAASSDNVIDESNVELLTDADALASGAKAFKLNCAPCHGETGGSMPGGVGPNLTDDYWLHGGTVTDIFRTIKYGVPAKGMVPWEAQLSPTKIQEVASYIKSLRGTNPPNAKEPQGDLFTEETADEAAPAETDTEADSTATETNGEELTLAD